MEELLNNLLVFLKVKRIVALDTETNGLFWYKGHKPFLFIVAELNKPTIVTEDVKEINEYLEDEDTILVMHNAKFDLSMLMQVGIDIYKLFGRVHDTTILMHLLFELENLSLEKLAPKYLNKEKLTYKIDEYFKSQGILKGARDYSTIPKEIIREYAAVDAELTLELFIKFMNKLIIEDEKIADEHMKQYNIYKIECELIFVLVDMYHVGLKIDRDYYTNLAEEYDILIYDYEQAIYEIAGEEFNIDSAQQLARKLISQGVVLPSTDKGNYKVDKETLEDIDSPLSNAITKYRKAKKLRQTYMIGMVEFATKENLIYTDLNTNGAKTGRFSSKEPNLQNIPRPDDEKPETLLIRAGFIPKDDYYQFYFDYDQQEYRVFMAVAQDEEVLRKINEENADFHGIVLEKMKAVIPTRPKIKTFNFLMLYGGGVNALTKKIHLTIQEATKAREFYFNTFKKVKELFTKINTVVRFRGYLITKFGRRRRLKGSEAYKGVNFIIQGGCADFIKWKMVQVWKELRKLNAKSKLVHQVHDELIVDIHKDELYLVPIIRAILEKDAMEIFGVKLTVGVDYACPNWANKKEYKGVI